MSQSLTPIQRLQIEKKRITEQCFQQEKKLNKDFIFIQENAANLLLTGLSSLLFPQSKKGNKKAQSTLSLQQNKSKTGSVSFSDYLSFLPSIFSLIWEITSPIITTWGIKKIRHWLSDKLFNKKKKTINN